MIMQKLAHARNSGKSATEPGGKRNAEFVLHGRHDQRGEAGKLDLALPLQEEALKLMKARLGPDHPDTLACMHNLAVAVGPG
jgi:hypothetical protein